jgi:type II secretory pathway component GspD/PulD (secretin)
MKLNFKWLIVLGLVGINSSGFAQYPVAGAGPNPVIEPGPAPRSYNVNASQPYANTIVLADIRMNIDKETEQVHFVRDNNDPYVVTKTYVLKHADPYEMRPYIRSAVQSKRVSSDNTTVECIKMNDGTNVLMVSAEEFRFKDNSNGMSIDDIVAKLDMPKMDSSTGQKRYFYFPNFTNARQLADMVRNVGANPKGDQLETQEGKDTIVYDGLLNCVFFYTPNYSKKNIEYMLKQYDIPNNEVSMKYSVYEIFAENDGKIGADFQSWKNNDGTDLLTTGARYRSNWSATYAGDIAPNGSSKTQMFNFNPKWNSRYLDFLTAKGNAKILTTGTICVRNNRAGYIERRTNLMNAQYTGKIPNEVVTDAYMALDAKKFVLSTISAAAAEKDKYRIKAYDTNGTKIDFSGPFTGNLTITKVNDSQSKITRYYLDLQGTAGVSFIKGGVNFGQQIEAGGFLLERCLEGTSPYFSPSTTNPPVSGSFSYTYTWTPVESWNTDNNMTVYKGYQMGARPNPNGYGFKIQINPAVCEAHTILDVAMNNDSLIGWNSDGTPRVAKNNTVQTKIMVSHASNQFIIGGLEKQEVVRGVTGVPFLKDLPILGWAFSTESESTKKSQLILVAECSFVTPNEKMKDGALGDVSKLKGDVADAGDKNSWGFQQLEVDGKMKF